MPQFKGIKYGEKSLAGENLFSGQLVEVSGRITPKKEMLLTFDTEGGFSLTDWIVHRVIVDVSWLDRLLGSVKFFLWSIK